MAEKLENGHVRVRLGRTGLEVSEISLGTWTLGGPNWNEGSPVGWGNLDIPEAEKAVHQAVDLGVNHFDSADVYGNGRSELMLGRLLGAKRKDLVLATKVGWHRGTSEYAYKALNIRHQCLQSLENLRTDYIDIYYFHHGDFGENDRYLDEAVEEMRKLKSEGKIRHIGLSAYTQNDFKRLIPIIDPDVLQSSAHMLNLKMIDPGSPVAKLIAERDLGFVAFSPMAQGLLLDKYDAGNPPTFPAGDKRSESIWFTREFLLKMKPKLEALKERFGSTTAELVRVNLQYILSYDAVSCVIPGFRNREQVAMNVAPSGKHLSKEEAAWIRELMKDQAKTE